MLVEATVADGIPGEQDDRPSGTLAYMVDWVKFRLKELASVFSLYGLLGLLRRLALSLLIGSLLLLSPAAVTFFLTTLAAIFGLRWFRHRAKRPRSATPPLITALNKLLRTMDRRLAKSGLYRSPTETLHAFARRIEDSAIARSANWYRRYAQIRYSTALTDEDVTDLKRSLDKYMREG